MRLEKKATVVSTCVAGLLVLLKMSVGILSGSIAVLASAIDSFLDLTVSLFNYFALNSAEKDPDDMFHYGRGKIEPLAAVIEGVVVSLSALFILYEALVKFAHPRDMDHMSESIFVMIASFVITAFLVMFFKLCRKKNKKYGDKSRCPTLQNRPLLKRCSFSGTSSYKLHCQRVDRSYFRYRYRNLYDIFCNPYHKRGYFNAS
jgi:cation diffusion facilitator family transporter